MRALAIVMALIVPPVAVAMIRGIGLGFWVSLIGFVLAQGLFWGLFAGPGFALWGLMIGQALVVAVLLRRSDR